MLTRATARQREISIRISLGASDWTIIKQLIVEGLLLSLMGAVAGVALAYALMPSLLHAEGVCCRRERMFASTLQVLLFTAIFSICAGVFFGVAPAGHVRLTDLRSVLNETERAGSGKRAKLLRNGLVVSEISLALLLLMGAGLFVRSLSRLSAVNLGFSDDHILVADLPVPPAGSAPAEAHRNMDFYENTLRELRTLPGVSFAAASSFLPVSGQGSAIHFNIQGSPPRNASEYILANYRVASSEYFQALRIPLLQGRWIEDSDREKMPPVVVINQAMAQAYFGDQSPLGKKLQIGATTRRQRSLDDGGRRGGQCKTVAGHRYAHRDVCTVSPGERGSAGSNHVSCDANRSRPALLIPELRETVRRINPDQPVVHIRTMEENVAQNFSQPHFRALLLLIFAGLALLIAAVGVYGVMAYSTAQRSGEMAIRMALGCSVERIFTLVLTDGLRLTLIGVGIGAALSIVLGHWLKSLLFGVSSTDAVTLLARDRGGCDCRDGGYAASGAAGVAG